MHRRWEYRVDQMEALRQVTDLVPVTEISQGGAEQRRRPRADRYQPEQRLDQRTLAGAVRPHDADIIAALDLKGNILKHPPLAITARQQLCSDYFIRHCRPFLSCSRLRSIRSKKVTPRDRSSRDRLCAP